MNTTITDTLNYNSTSDGLVALSSFSDFGAVIFIAVFASIIIAVLVLISSSDKYSKFRKIIDYLLKKIGLTYEYFKYGLYGWLIVGVISLIGYYCYVEASGGFPTLKIIGIILGCIIGFYLITCLIGLPVKHLIKRFDTLETKYKEKKDEGKVKNRWRLRKTY